MRLFTWEDDGNRVSYDVPYRPYYYVETNNRGYVHGHGNIKITSLLISENAGDDLYFYLQLFYLYLVHSTVWILLYPVWLIFSNGKVLQRR